MSSSIVDDIVGTACGKERKTWYTRLNDENKQVIDELTLRVIAEDLKPHAIARVVVEKLGLKVGEQSVARFFLKRIADGYRG